MRESQRADVHDRWVLSTNRPYRRLSNLWFLTGVILTADVILYTVIYLTLPFSFLASMLGIAVALAVEGAYMFAGGAFLYHDSRTIHKEPFPEGTPCNSHTNQMAYDRCAICGAFKCTRDLTRIRQSLKFSPGMFAFDGVACQECARRRVKRLRAISTGLLCLALPLIVVSAVGVFMQLPSQLGVLFVVILGIVILTLLPIGYGLWRKGWRVVTTPLSEQPALMTPISERLAEKGTIGDTIRYKRVAAPSI